MLSIGNVANCVNDNFFRIIGKFGPQPYKENMHRFVSPLIVATLAALALVSCQPRRTATRGETRAGGAWQVIWVNPEVVATDPVFTLFRSDKVDSVQVDAGVAYFPGATPSLTFQIETRRCETAVRLYDSRRRLVKVLLDKGLPTGYYKISFSGVGLASGVYTLQAEFCGHRVYRQVTVRR